MVVLKLAHSRCEESEDATGLEMLDWNVRELANDVALR